MQIGVRDQGAEGVGVGIHALVAVGPLHRESEVEAVLAPRDRAFPQSSGVAQSEFGGALAGGCVDDGHARCAGQHRAQPELAGVVGMQAEHCERVAVATRRKP